MTYPNERVVSYNYPGSVTAGDRLSRVANSADDASARVKLAEYSYLAAGTPYKVAHPQVTGASARTTGRMGCMMGGWHRSALLPYADGCVPCACFLSGSRYTALPGLVNSLPLAQGRRFGWLEVGRREGELLRVDEWVERLRQMERGGIGLHTAPAQTDAIRGTDPSAVRGTRHMPPAMLITGSGVIEATYPQTAAR